MDSDISALRKAFTSSLKKISTHHDLKGLHIEYLGRKGYVNALFSKIKKLPKDTFKEYAILLNECKSFIEEEINKKESELISDKKNTIYFDETIPGRKPKIGNLHPTTKLIRELNSFFTYHGYSVYRGPEIETEEYNFEKLNLPPGHPARDLQDTLYIKEDAYLLRTHTSSVEVRAMLSEKPPLRIVVPGKVYRNETSNVTNNSMFYHYEGLVIDKNVSMAHLKWTLVNLVKHLYGSETKTRFRCKYYPQVEPGAGLDVQCFFCNGKGCDVCKQRGWIEVLGAGMVHPHVLESCDIDTNEWSGFAFGIGLDRLVMLKYSITDIRKLYNGELVIM